MTFGDGMLWSYDFALNCPNCAEIKLVDMQYTGFWINDLKCGKKIHDKYSNGFLLHCVTPELNHTLLSCDQAALWMVQSEGLPVCLSVWNIFFHYVPIIALSWNFQETLSMTEVMSIQQIKVIGQMSRSQWSKPNLAVSRLKSHTMMISCTQLDDPKEMCSIVLSRSCLKFQGHE